jgi:putative Mg2+ transporter-C (MgtC) family protein
MTELPLLDFTLRIACAFGLGAIVGLERQWRQRMAGLRTNTLVSTGAALFVTVGSFTLGNENRTQIAAYIVSGVGFLAGAVIFKQNFSITGLNTAGTLWASAAVGTLAGVGAFPEAAVGAGFILAVNVILRPIGQRINLRPMEGTEVVALYTIDVSCPHDNEARVRSRMFYAIAQKKLNLVEIGSEHSADDAEIDIQATVASDGRANEILETIVADLTQDPAVTAASWKIVPFDNDERVLGASSLA